MIVQDAHKPQGHLVEILATFGVVEQHDQSLFGNHTNNYRIETSDASVMLDNWNGELIWRRQHGFGNYKSIAVIIQVRREHQLFRPGGQYLFAVQSVVPEI